MPRTLTVLFLQLTLAASLGCSEVEVSAAEGAAPQGTPSRSDSGQHLDEPPASILDQEGSPLVLRVTQPSTADLDAVHQRELLRVLVSFSRTNFFIADGKLRGFEYELFRELQEHLEAITPKGSPPPIVAFLPVPFEELLPALIAGRGDVVAASLTVTPERSKLVDFTEPYLNDVDEVLVANVDAPRITEWAQLGGEEVFVQEGSSYAEHLALINSGLEAAGKEPLRIRSAARGLGTEDLLEMVSTGALRYTVADRYLAELWSGVLEGLRLEVDLTTGHSGHLAWAVRRNNPKLKAMLDGFLKQNRKGTLIGNVLFKRYYGETKWLRNPLFDTERSKLAPFRPTIQQLCEQYDFDWRLIAAQAYQESGLDPAAVSRSGAIGLMQLLPSTAEDMGVSDLFDPGENLRAGVKYMDWLRKSYFSDPALDPAVRVDFALAAYNAGPGNVKRWRAAAPERGLDPDRWFDNVELIALETVGMQPVQYVGNINKYFVLYSLALDEMKVRGEALSSPVEASSR